MARMAKSKKSKPTETEVAASGKAQNPPPEQPSESTVKPVVSGHPEQDTPPATIDEERDFESFYLKQVTAEFADDLDKLRRNASDFNEKSVPILIDALKATADVYSEEEKAKAMGTR
ncbi:MAG: hypothetical protein LQ346_007936 [Caloplaca aetnensis]|nr:MAG: hypothetical protein LQ346_007936 [Caloplaca aetnensis]